MTANMAEIIIVRYNQPVLEERCIVSVRRHTNLKQHRLTVVDNYARDKNLGALWNEWIGASKAQFVCLLNSDTVVEPEWLERMLVCAEETHADAVGPRTNNCGTPAQRGDRGAGYLDTGQLSGFCLLLRRSAWEAAKGFREDAPFYGQESNLLIRIGRKVICREVFIHHEAGGSVKPSGRALEERRLGAEWWRRTIRFNWKHRLAILGSPASPFPLWQGINQAVTEFARERMVARHFDNAVSVVEIQKFKPTVILLVSQRWGVIHDCAAKLKPLSVPKGCWFNDLRNAASAALFAGAFQKIFLCFQDSAAYSWNDWRRESRCAIGYMPQGSIINTELAPLQIQREAVFIGGIRPTEFHHDRREIIDAIHAAVFNSGDRAERIRIEQASKLHYRQSRFSLAVSPSVPGYTSLRLYNIMAYGGLALTRRFPGIDRLMEDRCHYLGWSKLEEAQRVMREFRDNPDECERIRKRAWRLQQAKHTVAMRLMNMTANLTTSDDTFWGATN